MLQSSGFGSNRLPARKPREESLYREDATADDDPETDDTDEQHHPVGNGRGSRAGVSHNRREIENCWETDVYRMHQVLVVSSVPVAVR